MNRIFIQACIIYITVAITYLITQSIPISFIDFITSLIYLVVITFLPMTFYIILWLSLSEKVVAILKIKDKYKYLVYILINSVAPLLVLLIQGLFTWKSKLTYYHYVNNYAGDYFSEWGFIVIGILPTLIKIALDFSNLRFPKKNRFV